MTMDKEDMSEDREHINDIIDQSVNHTIRAKEDKKGVVQIEVSEVGEHVLKVYNGKDVKPTKVENVAKEKLMSMLDQKLD